MVSHQLEIRVSCHDPYRALCLCMYMVNHYGSDNFSISLHLSFLPLFIISISAFSSTNQSSYKKLGHHPCIQSNQPMDTLVTHLVIPKKMLASFNNDSFHPVKHIITYSLCYRCQVACLHIQYSMLAHKEMDMYIICRLASCLICSQAEGQTFNLHDIATSSSFFLKCQQQFIHSATVAPKTYILVSFSQMYLQFIFVFAIHGCLM